MHSKIKVMIHLYSHGHDLLDIYGHVHRRPHLMRVYHVQPQAISYVQNAYLLFILWGAGNMYTGLDYLKVYLSG